ncbi:Similar to GRHPR: Glyoxylate reductase/hydroxypyruvate reductase (Homo sapiens) [Cotesia congregata]|uniref:Glyoxylate reductase/hydroxypyruvate reductase n=1 Tax=Cotesia congregata TaxID=51543 RepID=A0A8J2HE62_COTCN|nr:Similar to GRHPR: Glyoxylate reductase/hydroxypyruvate reductase (Homo sapiens) [Cotesia congregata]
MSKPKVLVNRDDIPAAGLDLLRTKCELTILPGSNSTREEILRALPGHDGFYFFGHINVNTDFLDIAGPSLKVISTISAGFDHLDVPEIKRRGIKVGHTPTVLNAAVAEIAVMLLLNAARRAHESRSLLERGKVEAKPQWLLGRDVRGSTVGIVGLGMIGLAIAKRLVPFEIGRFLYTGHTPKKSADEIGAEFVSLDDLLKLSDFVIVATPLTIETHGLFDDVAFDKMKKTAIFINIGRGAVVKTDALLRALKEKKIFAAGLDVVDPEPLPKDHELLTLPNLEIVPHIGSATIKTRSDMAVVAAQNIINALEGKPLVYPLNMSKTRKVLVTREDCPQAGLDLLRNSKCELTIVPGDYPSREEIFRAIPGHDALYVVGNHVNINAELLDAAGPSLKIISTISSGYDHLDVPEIKHRGIIIGHTPVVLNAAVSEIAVMLLLTAARRAHESRLLLEAGKSERKPTWLLGQDVSGSTVGIVGLGMIGLAIAKRLVPFEIGRFLYTGHAPKKSADEIGAEFVSLDDLLELSDFVIVATPLTSETRGLFDDAAFDKMKKTAVFINIGRGAVVKTDALLRALKEKKIFAAGLDVVDPEPLPKDHELLTLPNLEIVPHIGSATVRTRNNMAIVAAQNLINALDGKPLVYPL